MMQKIKKKKISGTYNIKCLAPPLDKGMSKEQIGDDQAG
jgi:hypothetical protein